jgi:hypothetical protein
MSRGRLVPWESASRTRLHFAFLLTPDTLTAPDRAPPDHPPTDDLQAS